jgi:hypothetical protein
MLLKSTLKDAIKTFSGGAPIKKGNTASDISTHWEVRPHGCSKCQGVKTQPTADIARAEASLSDVKVEVRAKTSRHTSAYLDGTLVKFIW